jgi:hypothetical protein
MNIKVISKLNSENENVFSSTCIYILLKRNIIHIISKLEISKYKQTDRQKNTKADLYIYILFLLFTDVDRKWDDAILIAKLTTDVLCC